MNQENLPPPQGPAGPNYGQPGQGQYPPYRQQGYPQGYGYNCPPPGYGPPPPGQPPMPPYGQRPPYPPYPPYPPRPSGKRRRPFGEKIVLLALQAVVLMIAAFVVWGMVESRQSTNRDVSDRITAEWGGPIKIDGPEMVEADTVLPVMPDAYTAVATVKTEKLHRGIYEAEVFNAHVRLQSKFRNDSIGRIPHPVTVLVYLDTDHITNLTPLEIGGKKIDWTLESTCISAEVDPRDLADADVTVEFDTRGSRSIRILPLCTQSRITIDGDAVNPSFDGPVSPHRRELTWDKRFTATWDPSRIYDTVLYSDDQHIGTTFLVGVDRYQKVERSIKYAFIIILLTYVTVIFTEIVMKHSIPLLNYFLIGAALILFYTLLLALSEQMPFGWAYLLAAAMTVALITIYMWRMLKSRNVGVVMGAILTIIYTSCYIMLCISTYALLLGSLLLFFALAGLMFGSLKIKA